MEYARSKNQEEVAFKFSIRPGGYAYFRYDTDKTDCIFYGEVDKSPVSFLARTPLNAKCKLSAYLVYPQSKRAHRHKLCDSKSSACSRVDKDGIWTFSFISQGEETIKLSDVIIRCSKIEKKNGKASTMEKGGTKAVVLFCKLEVFGVDGEVIATEELFSDVISDKKEKYRVEPVGILGFVPYDGQVTAITGKLNKASKYRLKFHESGVSGWTGYSDVESRHLHHSCALNGVPVPEYKGSSTAREVTVTVTLMCLPVGCDIWLEGTNTKRVLYTYNLKERQDSKRRVLTSEKFGASIQPHVMQSREEDNVHQSLSAATVAVLDDSGTEDDAVDSLSMDESSGIPDTDLSTDLDATDGNEAIQYNEGEVDLLSLVMANVDEDQSYMVNTDTAIKTVLALEEEYMHKKDPDEDQINTEYN